MLDSFQNHRLEFNFVLKPDFEDILTIATFRSGTTRAKPTFEKYLRCPVTNKTKFDEIA